MSLGVSQEPTVFHRARSCLLGFQIDLVSKSINHVPGRRGRIKKPWA
jgi:hypothetical protein